MAHLDDHTFELFVLGAPEVADRKEEIAAHLAECAGCRNLAEKIAEFYREAETEFDRNPLSPTSPDNAVALRRSDVATMYEPIRGVTSRPRPTTLQRLRQFTRRHPFITGAGSFAFLSGIAALLAVVAGRDLKNGNPSYLHPNVGEGMMEVYSKENQLLWKLPARNLESWVDEENAFGIRVAQVADLDGDGKEEVVTGVNLILGRDQSQTPLRVLNAKGGLVWERVLGELLTFRGSKYNSSYHPHAIAVDDFSGSGRPEIIACAASLRSPCAIYRLSSTGDILGQYWHFGVLLGLYSIDLNGDGKSEIVVCGTNDMPDTSGDAGKSTAVIVVLDPRRIIGVSESAFTRGFGFPTSDAELKYIELPRSDMHELLGLAAETRRLDLEADSSLTFVATTGLTGQSVVFYFNFSRDFRPLSVKSNDSTERLHSQLASEGRLRAKWGAAYLDDLRAHVKIFSRTQRPDPILP